MDINFFKTTKILDGGMGQELLARGLKAKGTLWSSSALINNNYHQIVIDTHLDYINAGADIITTNSFSSRRERLIENNCPEKFDYANKMAGELAVKAKKISIENLAKKSIFFENEVLNEMVCIKDQNKASVVGFNKIDINKKGKYKIIKID